MTTGQGKERGRGEFGFDATIQFLKKLFLKTFKFYNKQDIILLIH